MKSLIVLGASIRWFRYKGGYQSTFYTYIATFYGLPLYKDMSFSVVKESDYYRLRDYKDKGKGIGKIPLSHVSNLSKFLKTHCKQIKDPSVAPTVTKVKPLTEETRQILKDAKIFFDLFSRYRHKFPPTSDSHIKIFQWAKDFSGVSNSGSTLIYRGSKLRGIKVYKVGQKLLLSHARYIMSFSGKKSVASQFARIPGMGGKKRGVSYILKSNVPNERILISVKILNAISRKLKAIDLELSKDIWDAAYDLKHHEDEYFVLSKSKVPVTVVQVFNN